MVSQGGSSRVWGFQKSFAWYGVQLLIAAEKKIVFSEKMPVSGEKIEKIFKSELVKIPQGAILCSCCACWEQAADWYDDRFRCTSGKVWKIFKFELAKTKIGDILRIRCVLSVTRLLDKSPWAVRDKKLKKNSNLSLQKTKIGDILRIRCVLSATRLLDKLPRAVRNKKLKNFWNWACKNKNWWYIKKLLLRTGQADWKLNSAM